MTNEEQQRKDVIQKVRRPIKVHNRKLQSLRFQK